MIISERNREGNLLTMLESAGKRTSLLPVLNDKAEDGRLGGTNGTKVAIQIKLHTTVDIDDIDMLLKCAGL